MTLTLPMITEQMAGMKITAITLMSGDSVESIRLGMDTTNMENGILYITLLSDNLTECATRRGSSFQVEADIVDVFNLIMNIFEKYSKWDEQLRMACAEGCTLAEILDLSYPIIPNPILILDSNEWYVASTSAFDHVNVSQEWTDLIDRHTADPQLISAYNQLYHDYFQKKSIYLVPDGIFSTRIYAANLFLQNQFAGIIIFVEYKTKYTQGLLDACTYLYHRIQSLINSPSSNLFHSFSDYSLEEYLQDNSSDSLQRLEHSLARSLWQEEDRKAIIFAQPTVDSLLAPTPSQSRIIFSKMEGIFVSNCQNGLVFLCNERILTEKIHSRDPWNANSPISRDCFNTLKMWLTHISYCGGISFAFTNLKDLPRYYRQACLALEFGQKVPGTINLCQDFVLPYIFSVLKDENANIVQHPCLDQLRQYDEHHASSLYETLFVYLKNERSQKKTAEELHVHRSTLIHRLDNLKTLLGDELEDADTRMHILISYYLDDAELSMRHS